MKTYLSLACLLVSGIAYGQNAYIPPASSTGVLEGVNFAGEPVGQKFRNRFSECDARDMCDGKPLKYGCSGDKNHNSTLLKLKDDRYDLL